jgi:hypothetical protein
MEVEMRPARFRTAKKHKGETEWHGLSVYYEVVYGDWYGDPDIPNGTCTIEPYVDVLIIKAPDGEEITDLIIDSTIEEIETMILEAT